MTEVTELLRSIDQGDRHAASALLPLVYDELRRLAAAQLAKEGPGQTLQPTALVHEAYLRLVGSLDEPRWDNAGHFFGAAAEAMRRILVERARRKASVKHGGAFRRVDFDHEMAAGEAQPAELLMLDEALTELEVHDRRAAEALKLRYFAGLTLKETAAAMRISMRTADRLWALAKAWMYLRLTER